MTNNSTPPYRSCVPVLTQQVVPAPTMPAAPSKGGIREMKVNYEYLTADECDALKNKVKDQEKNYEWKTYGPNHDEELQKYSIDNLSTQHLENLLITQRHLTNEYSAAILMLLKKRYSKYGAV